MIWGGVLLGLALLWVLGPRPRVDTRVATPALPPDAELCAWLEAREAAVPDLTHGAEARIRYAEPEAPGKRPIALVYLHGFTATRQEVAPVSQDLARRLGANLFEARLAGHGSTGEALAEASVEDWLAGGEEALAIGRRLGERVVVIASSTGATLATWLACQPRHADIAGWVFLSPNFGPKDHRSTILTWPWGGQLARLIVGPTAGFEPRNELHETFWTTRYPTRALVAMQALVDLAQSAPVEGIGAPTLALYDPDDRVIDAALVPPMMARFGGGAAAEVFAETRDVKHHILAGDILSPASNEAMTARLQRFVEGLPRGRARD